MPMLISLALVSLEEGKLPPFTGNLVRGWFLNSLREANPDLASKLHSALGPKPFSVKPLRPVGFKMNVKDGQWIIEPNRNYIFDIGIVDDEIIDDVFNVITKSAEKTVEFHKVPFKVDTITIKKKTYEELYSADIGPRIGIEFITPTAFSQPFIEFDYLFPEPVRVFGNLLRIWNKYAPKEYQFNPEEVLENCKKLIKVRSYKLRTREVQIEKNIIKVGVQGRMEIIVYEENLRKIIASLLGLSEFSNVGIKRTYGMGVIKYTDLSQKMP